MARLALARTAIAAVATALAAAALAPAVASATPSSGLTAETLGQVALPFDVTGEGADSSTVTLRRITFAPGGTTGWHYHQGPVIALVADGTLTRTLADCSVVTSPAVQVVEEEHGADARHIGANHGTTPVDLWTLYLEPGNAPLSDDAPAVDCG